MSLTEEELLELNRLKNKATDFTIDQSEMDRMIELVNKSEEKVFNSYLKNIGYSSTNDYRKDISKSNDLLEGLLLIIGGILIAKLIGDLFKE